MANMTTTHTQGRTRTWAITLLVISLLGIGPLLFGPPDNDFYLMWLDPMWLVIVALPLLWGLFALFTFVPGAGAVLRTRPVITVVASTLLFFILITFGVIVLQPMRIHPFPKLSLYWAGVCLWVVFFPTGYVMDRDDRRAMGETLTRSHIDKVLVLLTTLFIVFMGAEFFLRYIYIFSTGTGTGPTTRYQWRELYWAENSLGYRDREPEETDKQVVLVVGDSFVAGQGVTEEENRFSNRLGVLLGDDYEVYTVAKPGWGTRTQLHFLPEFPLQPDILIYSFVVDDIRAAYVDVMDVQPPDQSVFQQAQRTIAIVNRLFIADYYYFYHSAAFRNLRSARGTQPVHTQYNVPEVWAVNRQEIQGIIDYARGHDAEVVALVWAGPPDDTADAWQNPVTAAFEENNVPVLHTTPLVAHLPRHQRFASRHDRHPGEAVQPIIAQALYDLLLTNDIIDNR